MLETAEKFEFGPFVLEPGRHSLSASGRPVTLHGRAFDILELLVRERARVLSQKEILEKVWGGQAVDPKNLTVQISALRSALAAHAGGERLIHTIPNRGYRFIGEVTVRKPAPARPPPEAIAPLAPSHRPEPIAPGLPVPLPDKGRRFRLSAFAWSLSLLVLLLTGGIAARAYFQAPAPSSPRFSIAVLPFRSAGPDHSQDFLADAVTDDLISDLAHIPGSTVIARETAEAVKTKPPPLIGRELHVRYVVAGTLTIDGDLFYATAHLIDAASGAQIWSSSLHNVQKSLSATRQFLVLQLGGALQLKLDQLASLPSPQDRPDDPDALGLFFRARARLDTDDSEAGLADAQSQLEQALEKSPGFADAGAELGWLLLRKVMTQGDETLNYKDWMRAREVIDQTLRLAPNNALAVAAKARELFIDRRYREAQATAETALSIAPSSVEAHWVLANCAWMLGQLDAEAQHLQAIALINPEGGSARRQKLLLGINKVLQFDPAAAIDLLMQAIVGEPDPQPGADTFSRAEWARVWLIAAYGMHGEPNVAKARYAEYNRIWPNRSVWRFGVYLPRAVAPLASAKAVLRALHDAGMPMTGDSTVSLPAKERACGPDAYNPTPTTLSHGGRTINADELDRMMTSKVPPLLLDVGEGTAAIPGAQWFDTSGLLETSLQFVSRIVTATRADGVKRGVVVMGDGPFGCSSYNAATSLITAGFNDIAWYRGGEETWASSGRPTVDFRAK